MKYKLIKTLHYLAHEKKHNARPDDDEVELHLNLSSEMYSNLQQEFRDYSANEADLNFEFETKVTTFNLLGTTCYIQEGELKNKDTRDFLEQYEKLKQQHDNSN